MTIIIEKNIPVQQSKGGAKQIYPFDQMKKGESFEVGEYERKKVQSIYGSIYHYIKKEGNTKKKFVCRKTDNGKIRVWRTA